MDRYNNYFGRHYADQRHQEYLRLIHDLSKKLSSENVQSISFLRHASTDCYGYPLPCVHGAHAPAMAGPTNRGLEVLDQLWQNGVFGENNLEPLVKLLRDIGRHDLADECSEKSSKMYCDLHRYRPPPPIPVPPTLYDPNYRDGVDSDKTQEVIGDYQSEKNIVSGSELPTPGATRPPFSAPTTTSSMSPLQLDKVSNATHHSMSRSIPIQRDFGTAETDTSMHLSTTAPNRSCFRRESTTRDIHLTLNKPELDKILQCIESDSDPKLKEKLLHAVSSHDDIQSRGDGVKQHNQAIHSATPPKVVTNSGRQMTDDVINFSSQASSSSNQHQLLDPNDGKFVLRRQKSVLHVRSIDTPIPAPLTPQPQRSHKKLEACSSNSSTDSGLSQCRSQRSSTISNTSSSAFLSEDEEEQKNGKENGHNEMSTISADSALTEQRSDSEATSKSEPVESRDSSRAVQSDKERRQSTHERTRELVKKLDDKGSHKSRRQSESTKDVIREEREKHALKKGHTHISRKRNRAISLPELPPLNPPAKTGMNIDWRIPRDDFIDPIFHHKNKTFEKKCRFSTGSGSSTLNVQLAIRLYPNGINWDNGAYSTLKIETTNTSRPPPHTAYIQFDIKGYDCYAGNVIASRQVEYPLKKGAFIIPEFLSHEVIKVSHAKNFEFRATIKIKYLVCRDWVVVAADQAGTSCY